MLGLPVESWYLWVGLATVSAALVGIAVELPTTTPPDAAAVAATVDGVAASPYAAVAEHPLRADAVRLSAARIALRRDSPAAFEDTTQQARERDPSWRPAPDPLTVRRVSWGGVDATLVG